MTRSGAKAVGRLAIWACAFVIAGPAVAGGWTGVADGSYEACAALGPEVGSARTLCVTADGDLIAAADAHRRHPVAELRQGVRCAYPHRPSDSVFVGGSGYLLKDTMRARRGCL